MKQQIVCIVAAQRSGTTALQANLAATGRFHNFGEIFQTDGTRGPGAFLSYCANRRILFTDTFAPHYLSELCHAYISHLRDVARDRHVLIDVKFNSWGVIRPAWRYIHEEPYFLQFLKKLDAFFIFIRREDLVEQIVSSHIARSHGRWHNLEAEDATTTADIDVDKAAREARLILQSEAFLWSRLNTYGRRLHVTYEELFVSGNISTSMKEAIAGELGEPLLFPEKSPIGKSGVNKAASVKNYEDARQAIGRVAAKFPRPAKT
jgi:LPS sulfotransferase NodH